MTRTKEQFFTPQEILENLPALEPQVSIVADLKDGGIDQNSGEVIVGFRGCVFQGRGSDHESAYANFVRTFSRQGSWASMTGAAQRSNDPAVFLAIKAKLAANELRAVVQLPPSDSRP